MSTALLCDAGSVPLAPPGGGLAPAGDAARTHYLPTLRSGVRTMPESADARLRIDKG